MRLLRCDTCAKEIEVLTFTTENDEADPCFCTYRCLSEWAQARVLIESAGGES